MSSPQAVIGLCTALLALAGCTDEDIARNLALLTGKLDKLEVQLTDARDRLSSAEVEGELSESELAALRAEYAALALSMEAYTDYASAVSSEAPTAPSQPETEPSASEPQTPAVEPPVALNEHQRYLTDPGYVCEPVFRLKSCTDWGEPVWLNDDMSWKPFGEVP